MMSGSNTATYELMGAKRAFGRDVLFGDMTRMGGALRITRTTLGDKAHGEGTFWHVHGDQYQGSWVDDKAHGYGTYSHANGAKYQGYWQDDLQHGHGVEEWTDGSKYEGYYVMGRKHGQGSYTWKDGS